MFPHLRGHDSVISLELHLSHLFIILSFSRMGLRLCDRGKEGYLTDLVSVW